MLYRYQNLVLQFVVLVCMGVIGGLIYHNYNTIVDGDKTLTKKIDDIDVSCPKCPDITNPVSKEDLVCHPKDDEDDGDDEDDEVDEDVTGSRHSPPSQCPTVAEIAQAIFPGRNTGVTQAGRYFDIKSNDSYELLPDYSFFKPEDAFPEDSILDKPLRDGNVQVSQDQIDNSQEGNMVDTGGSASRRGSQTRMGARYSKQRDLDARMSRGSGMSDSDRLKQANKAVASKDPGDASSRLAASAQEAESRESKNRRREMADDAYN